MKTRAIRRHHTERLKQARRRYWYGCSNALDARRLGKVVATPKPCSCWMCGNPRRFFREKSIQEKRAETQTHALR